MGADHRDEGGRRLLAGAHELERRLADQLKSGVKPSDRWSGVPRRSRITCTWCTKFFPWNRGFRAINSPKMQPTDQQSTAAA